MSFEEFLCRLVLCAAACTFSGNRERGISLRAYYSNYLSAFDGESFE